MVEGGAKEFDEASMMEAMDLAFVEIQKIISATEGLQAKVAPSNLRFLEATENRCFD